MTPQALAKAAVGDVVYYILRGEELVTVTAHKPEAATRLGVTIKNLTVGKCVYFISAPNPKI